MAQLFPEYDRLAAKTKSTPASLTTEQLTHVLRAVPLLHTEQIKYLYALMYHHALLSGATPSAGKSKACYGGEIYPGDKGVKYSDFQTLPADLQGIIIAYIQSVVTTKVPTEAIESKINRSFM